MKDKGSLGIVRAVAGLVALVATVACGGLAALAQGGGSTVEHGAYLYAVAGCGGCHTDTKNKGPEAAGGPPLKTPFGTFYAPNITPDPEYGIGKWSDADFIRALRDGVDPDEGSQYFPVFPFTSFTRMTNEDMKAIKAYIFTLKPVAKPSREHDVGFPFNIRFLQVFWKWLFFDPGVFRPDPAKSAAWNRGAYLVEAVAHCSECHTPRNLLGGPEKDRRFAGAKNGPEGEKVPNITPAGIGKWSASDLSTYLATGLEPGGDVAGSLMADVIERSTSKLTDADRAAIVVYIKSLPPIRGGEEDEDKD